MYFSADWLLWGLIALVLGGAWFNGARRAAEIAHEVGRRACRRNGVQWLDESVHATSVRLRRKQNGWLGLERSFRFEYSRDGSDRHAGSLSLLGGELVRFVGPVREDGQTNSLNFGG